MKKPVVMLVNSQLVSKLNIFILVIIGLVRMMSVRLRFLLLFRLVVVSLSS